MNLDDDASEPDGRVSLLGPAPIAEIAAGELVRAVLPDIIEYVRQVPAELERLMNGDYSTKHFGLTFPFFMDTRHIQAGNVTDRYWVAEHQVNGRAVRVTNNWFVRNVPLLLTYLDARGISRPEVDVRHDGDTAEGETRSSRYKLHAIGNAQNSLVRNVLGQIGTEKFSEKDWRAAVEELGGRCVYCGRPDTLVMDHAVPINRASLGEHRLGNLVPACRSCNGAKGQQRYDEFLRARYELKDGEAERRIEHVEAHMARHRYEPLPLDPEATAILDEARAAVARAAGEAIEKLMALPSPRVV